MTVAAARVDNQRKRGSLGRVPRLRKSLAVFITAFWLLATQHCGLEAAGILVPQCQQEDGSHGCSGTEHGGDGCEIVEGGGYKVTNGVAKISAPQLVACACLICVNTVELRSERVELFPRDYFEQPRDWVPNWQFVQRAALSPRAPSLGLA